MSRLEFPTTPLLQGNRDLQHHLAATPDLLVRMQARLEETLASIGSMTRDEAVLFPERSDRDWPHQDRLGYDPATQKAARTLWWKVAAAVERRVESIDPDSGGFNEANCWPVWRVYDAHWLAVIEAGAVYLIEPLMPSIERAQYAAQSRLWRSHARLTLPDEVRHDLG